MWTGVEPQGRAVQWSVTGVDVEVPLQLGRRLRRSRRHKARVRYPENLCLRPDFVWGAFYKQGQGTTILSWIGEATSPVDDAPFPAHQTVPSIFSAHVRSPYRPTSDARKFAPPNWTMVSLSLNVPLPSCP